MVLDLSITLGNIVAISAFLLSTGVLVGQLRALNDRVMVLEKAILSLTTLMIDQGRQEERLNALEARVSRLAQEQGELEEKVQEFTRWEPRR